MGQSTSITISGQTTGFAQKHHFINGLLLGSGQLAIVRGLLLVLHFF